MITSRQCRAARGLLAWSQADLAKACGLSKTAINNFETGSASIKQSSAESITDAFIQGGVQFTDNEGIQLRKDTVRIIRGEKPLIPLWEEILSTLSDDGGEVLIACVNETEGKKKYGVKLDQYIKQLKENNITERLLAKYGDANYVAPKEWYRWMPEGAYNYSLMTFVFADKVALMLWQESMLLLIDSKDAADAERERFEIMWDSATIPD